VTSRYASVEARSSGIDAGCGRLIKLLGNSRAPRDASSYSAPARTSRVRPRTNSSNRSPFGSALPRLYSARPAGNEGHRGQGVRICSPPVTLPEPIEEAAFSFLFAFHVMALSLHLTQVYSMQATPSHSAPHCGLTHSHEGSATSSSYDNHAVCFYVTLGVSAAV